MNDPSQLSFSEGFWIGLLVLQILALFYGCWTRSVYRLAWFQPPVILSVVFLFYTVVGPLKALQEGGWADRGVNLRDGFLIAWQGASIAFASFLVGYCLLRQKVQPPRRTTSFDPRQALRLGRNLNLIGLLLFTLTSGPRLLVLINPFTARESQVLSAGLDLGPFANYAGLAINLLIPGILLMVSAWIRNRRQLPEIVFWLIIASGLYTSLGFRWRLALLFSGLLMLWFIARGRAPRAVVVIPAMALLLVMAGLIGMTRSYGSGLDLSRVEGFGFWDFFLAGFTESNIFVTSGGVMNLTPTAIPYVGTAPLISTLLFPIPSALMPFKNSAEYLINATATVYGSESLATGSAILNYSEYYLMGGWSVLIGAYVLLGWLYRRLWLWFVWRRHEPIAQILYIDAVVFLYMIVSRGYLPAAVSLFMFTVAPMFYYYRVASKPILGPGLSHSSTTS